jgi:hypothetical protein
VGLAAHWLFPAWTGGKLVMHWPAFILLLVAVLINSLWYTALMVPYATNRHVRIAVFYSLIYGAGAFFMGYLGAKSLGLSGAALALMIVESIMAVIVVRVALQMTGTRKILWLKSTFQPPLSIFSRLVTSISRIVIIS